MQFEMPKPGPQHETLAKFVGEWIGEETMLPSPWSPEKQERQSQITGRMLEGFFLVSDYEQRVGDQVTFRGHGVYSWDPKEEVFLMYWFDSMGGAGGVAKGTLEGNELTFLNTSPMGHHRYRYTFEGEEYTFEMAMSQDGSEWQNQMEARCRKA